MTSILDLVSPAALTGFARQVPEPVENPLTNVLPNVRVQGVKTRTVSRVHRTTTAKYRSFDAEAPIGKRPDAVVVSELRLLPISEKLPINEDLLLELSEGTSDAGLARMRESIFDDAERLVTSVLNRAEEARGQFLSTGRITLDENGVVTEADYGLAADHQVTPGVLWGAAGATPLSDEIGWARVVRSDARRRPSAATTSEDVLLQLVRNEEYRNAFWQRGSDSPTLNLEQINQVRASHGLAPLNVYEGEVPTDDSVKRVIPENLFILTTDTVGESQWGITAEARQLVGSNAVDFSQEQAPGITVVQYNDQDPVTTWTKASSVFLPVAGDINGLLVADVLG